MPTYTVWSAMKARYIFSAKKTKQKLAFEISVANVNYLNPFKNTLRCKACVHTHVHAPKRCNLFV